MDTLQVCVNCHNNKPVNCTDNRLVTEACGHVKCMDCLISEKAGCSACSKKDSVVMEIPVDPVQTRLSLAYREGEKDGEVAVYEKVVKKKKLETSHIKIQSDENGKCYKCVPCNKTFHARSQVAYHAYCNGQSKPYICPVAQCQNKSFATHSHFEYHMRVHRNERTYSCDICGEGFFQMSKLQRHKLKHTKEKKFACSKCSKAFNNMTSLRKHSLTHTEERPYACADCGRRFRDGSNYKKHLEKHKEKKCTCSICGRELGSRHALLSHIRAAHEHRLHQCPLCPQSFRSGKDMRRHAAVHSDSKPFRCKVCKTQFRRKDNLERHIRNTHPDHVTSSAVEQIPDAVDPKSEVPIEVKAKKELELLNPLPPLSKEVIQKHMENQKEVKIPEKDLEKSFIIQANNTRETVIVEKRAFERRSPSPECEYVHKIRKANTMSRNVALPPIDVEKVKKLHVTNLDIGAPPKDLEMERRLKKILLTPSLDRGMNE